MPLYYFNIRSGTSVVPDTEGTELADVEMALVEARVCARDLAIEELKKIGKVDGRRIEVLDERGQQVASVAVRDVVD